MRRTALAHGSPPPFPADAIVIVIVDKATGVESASPHERRVADLALQRQRLAAGISA
jgi:hypothetical protein